jgi:chemotaxis protein methyltransferase CheR
MQHSDTDIELKMLMEAIYLKYSYDFRDYSGASIKRRCCTPARVRVRQHLGAAGAHLHEPAAFSQLLQYLTIPVSEMFRDPSYFAGLREQWCRCCAPIRR